MNWVSEIAKHATGVAKELFDSYTDEQKRTVANATQAVAQIRAKFIFAGQTLPENKAQAIAAIEANLKSAGITDAASVLETLLPVFPKILPSQYGPLDPEWKNETVDPVTKQRVYPGWTRPQDSTAEAVAARVKASKPKAAKKKTESEE